MADLAALLRRAMPIGVVLGVADMTRAMPLWPGEVIAPAVKKRQAEFAAGRAAARAALAKLGHSLAAIPVGPDRAPIWPAGVVGSISHCDGACMAVLAEARNFAGLGLDLEPCLPIAENLWPSLMRPEEFAAVACLPHAQRGTQVLRLFVAKEAVFKAQYAVTKAMIGFDEVSVSFFDQCFSASLINQVAPFAPRYAIAGKTVATDEFMAALAWIASA